MSNGNDADIENILDAYDHYHEEREDEVRQTEIAGSQYDEAFRQTIDSVIRPYFEEVALQLRAHGHAALVDEGFVSSPDHRLAGGSKITFGVLAEGKGPTKPPSSVGTERRSPFHAPVRQDPTGSGAVSGP